MSRVHYFVLSLILILTSFSYSQNEVKKWYFGFNAALDFMGGGPANVLGSQLYHLEGSSSIADAAGNLLFYTDGITVWDRNHTPMPNGTGLLSAQSSTQAALIVKQPGNTNIYYIFTTAAWGTGGSHYSVVDITLNGGFGDVTIKNTPMLALCSEKLAGTKHCNGTDIWIVNHEKTGNIYHSFLLTATGLSTSVQSAIGQMYSSNLGYSGQLKFSPNGTKLAAAINSSTFELYDFNKTTGIISNALVLGTGINAAYSVEFSQDNSKLYGYNTVIPGASTCLRQWDVCAGNSTAIIASLTTVATPAVMEAGALQLATDGKIYVANFSSMLGVINNPNNAGIACNYVNNGFSVAPNSSADGLPNFVSSYFELNNPLATLSPKNTTACQNNGAATATIIGSCGGAPYTYAWSNNITIGPTSATSDSITNLAAGNYSVIISDASCKKDTLYFTISGSSNIQITQNASICTGDSLMLPDSTYTSIAGTYIDTLQTSGGCDSIITTYLTVNLSIIDTVLYPPGCFGTSYTLPRGTIVSTSGTYSDTLYGPNGCDSIITSIITIWPPIPVSITASPSATINQGASVQLSITTGSTGDFFNWNPSSGLNTDTGTVVIATPFQTTTYCVTSTTIDHGCTGTTCVTIYIETPCPDNQKLNVPNAFSPNGDFINDEFCLQGWAACNEEFLIVIYNRWGEKVYESNSPDFCWNGLYNNTIMDPQVYTYYIKAKFTSGNKTIVNKGNISLIR